MVPDDLVTLGVVRGAYGVKGWVRIAPFAADDTVLEMVRRWWLMRDSAPQSVTVDEFRRQRTSIVAKWQQCASKDEADALKGISVAVARRDFPVLPQGEYYLTDLVGSRVINREGAELGTVSGLRSSGRDVGGTLQWLEVANEKVQKTIEEQRMAAMLIPLNDQYVDAVDMAAKLVRVDWQPEW